MGIPDEHDQPAPPKRDPAQEPPPTDDDHPEPAPPLEESSTPPHGDPLAE